MAGKRHRRSADASRPPGREEVLRRRARRHARKGDHRKASVALRELVALTGEPRHWVALGHALLEAKRLRQGLDALRQGLWHHQRAGACGRARAVARLILDVDPSDRTAARMLGVPQAA